ncbi:MAG: Txe/YoeB family addiction module toxin [Bacteroidaceae bacterium]|nr:Txe/YoeB family addiction module toxin [Bacteroidaceae bacterium]
MTYEVVYQRQALFDADKLKRSEPSAYKKFKRLIEELKQHPRTGTGHPEPLSGDRAGQWIRRITQRHRLVYEIHETEVIVLVLTAYGHYDDK